MEMKLWRAYKGYKNNKNNISICSQKTTNYLGESKIVIWEIALISKIKRAHLNKRKALKTKDKTAKK